MERTARSHRSRSRTVRAPLETAREGGTLFSGAPGYHPEARRAGGRRFGADARDDDTSFRPPTDVFLESPT